MEESITELDYFSQLTSSEPQRRVAGVKGILKRVKHNLKANQRVVYLIIKRLIRGLGGRNPLFREGCFSSLVGIFNLFPSDFELNLIEEIIENELSPTGNSSKQEEGEAYFGQCLAYGVMIVTDLIFHKPKEEQLRVFEKLFHIGKKRSYLHHVAFVFINMLLKKSGQEFSPEGFLDNLKDLSSNTLDKLNYIVTIADLSIKTHTIKKVLETKKLFDPNNVNKLTTLLVKYKSPKELEHEFYNNFINCVSKNIDYLKAFWSVFCDSKNNKDIPVLHLGSKLLKHCAATENGDVAVHILNCNFNNILIRNAKKEKQIVKSVLNDFCAVVKYADDQTKLNLLVRMIFEDGMINFDIVTNSKTIISLTNSLSFAAISELAEMYKSVIESKRTVPSVESKNKAVVICLNYYTKLINSPNAYEEINWRLSQLIYLLSIGFFKREDITFNRELYQHIQESFFTSLGCRFPNLDSFHLVIKGLATKMNEILRIKNMPPIVKFTEEMEAAWKLSISLSEKMNKFIENKKANKEIVLLLKIVVHYMAIFMLKEKSTAIVNIQDLKNIYKELKENQENNTMWIQVLVDLFLNLLSKPHYHHRHLIRCTFKFLCPYLTQEAFLQIVEALGPSKESVDGEDADEAKDNSDTSDDSDAESEENDEMETDDEDDEDDEDAITNNEKLRFELRNVLGAGSDNESIDLDDMDEEEGKKLDETLSGIFRANFKKRKTGRLSKYQNQVVHFHTRVMDLLEMCSEVVLPLSYWIKALIPLVDLLSTTIGQSKLNCLRTRINCFIKKLVSCKISYDEPQTNEIIDILTNLLEKASKLSGIYADMKPQLVLIIKFLLKSSKPFVDGLKPKRLEKNEVFKVYRKTLNDYFSGKINMPVQLFVGMANCWDGMLALAPDVLNHSFNEDIKLHQKLTGFKIFDSFIKAPQYFDGHLEKYYDFYLPKISTIFLDGVKQILQRLSGNEKIYPKYNTECWLLLNTVIVRQNNSQIPVMVNLQDMKDLLGKYVLDCPRMKGKNKKHFMKLCNILGIQNIQTKQKEVSNESESSAKENCIEEGSPKSLLKRKKKFSSIGKVKRIKKMNNSM